MAMDSFSSRTAAVGSRREGSRTRPERRTPGWGEPVWAASSAQGTRSLGWDDGVGEDAPGSMPHAEMELEEFAAAIPDGQLDFIVFEACLMAGVEVAYVLRGKTDYILSSAAEIVSPASRPFIRRHCDTFLTHREALRRALRLLASLT